MIVICILIIMSMTGFAQDSKVSKWIIDKQTSFTCQSITFSEDSDTVIFLNTVIFHSPFVQIDSAEKILYNKRSKKLIIEPPFKGRITLNDGKNGMKVLSGLPPDYIDRWKITRSIEYTLGQHVVIERSPNDGL
jgi:hypothetical protein